MHDGCVLVYRERQLSDQFERQLTEWVQSMDDYLAGVGAKHPAQEGQREQKWYQEDGHYFDASWKRQFARWEAHSYTDQLHDFQRRTQEVVDHLCDEHGLALAPRFNSLLLNKYRNGRDSIRAHSDSPHSFGPTPLIAVVSLGETRTFKCTSKTDPSEGETVELASGSILLMAGQMQQRYTHEIVREPHKTRPRYSLTWRHFLLPH